MKNKLIVKLLNCFIATTAKNNLTIQQYNNGKSQKGFTLIELLVVIAIIGLLTSFLLANFVGVRERARDGQRKSDLRNIQAALEIYRSDKAEYPSSLPACGGTWQEGGAVYMQSVPCDPLNTGKYIYSYTYTAADRTYSLVGCLENTNDSQKDPTNDGSKCDGENTNWSLTLENP